VTALSLITTRVGTIAGARRVSAANMRPHGTAQVLTREHRLRAQVSTLRALSANWSQSHMGPCSL